MLTEVTLADCDFKTVDIVGCLGACVAANGPDGAEVAATKRSMWKAFYANFTSPDSRWLDVAQKIRILNTTVKLILMSKALLKTRNRRRMESCLG